MKRLYFILFSLAMIPQTETVAQNQQLTPELLWKIGRVTLDCVSPDGQQVVYGVTRYDLPTNKSGRALYLVNIQG